jgi:hypothetical protein
MAGAVRESVTLAGRAERARLGRRFVSEVLGSGQPPQPVGVVADLEAGYDLPRLIHHAHRVLGSGPVDPGNERGIRQRKRQLRLLIKFASKTRRGGWLPDGN